MRFSAWSSITIDTSVRRTFVPHMPIYSFTSRLHLSDTITQIDCRPTYVLSYIEGINIYFW